MGVVNSAPQPQPASTPAPANLLEVTLASIFAPREQSGQAREASTEVSPALTEKRRHRRAGHRTKGNVSASSADPATVMGATGNVSTHAKRATSTSNRLAVEILKRHVRE